jgi:ferredoxin
MRVRLQSEKCVGHAQCHAVDPEMFPIDDDGYSTLTTRSVTDGELSVVKDGVAACPELALILEDET